jgi:hypothetical protein
MRLTPAWIGAALLLGASLAPLARAVELAPLSAAELRRRCLAYVEDSHSADGRSCSAYVRGFVEGSPLVRVYDPDDAQPARESFSERAFRTRVGVQGLQRPLYCVASTVTLPQFVSQMLDHLEEQPPGPDASASDVLLGVLRRSYRCAA